VHRSPMPKRPWCWSSFQVWRRVRLGRA
jgi:hypothetical protein